MVSFPESIILANCHVCHTISTNSYNFYGERHVFFILPNRVDVCHILHFWNVHFLQFFWSFCFVFVNVAASYQLLIAVRNLVYIRVREVFY